MITIFTTEGCPGCRMVEKVLTEKGVSFDTHKVPYEDRAEINHLKEKGYRQFPVVELVQDGKLVDAFTGFNPPRLTAMLAKM